MDKIILKGNRRSGIRTAVGAVSTATIASSYVLVKGFIGQSLIETLLMILIYILAFAAIVFLVYLLTISKIVIFDDYIVIYRGMLRKKAYFSNVTRCFLRGSVLTLYCNPSEVVIDLNEYVNSEVLPDILRTKGIAIEAINLMR